MIELTDRAVIVISGEDSESFLQGLITNDIRKASESEAIFAALLSPQGKFLFDFFIVKQGETFLFETDKLRAPELIKRLGMYRLRSKVEIKETDLRVGWSKARSGNGLEYADPRMAELGFRNLTSEIPASGGTTNEYDLHRLSLGVPEGSKDLIVDRSILLECGYDELHAIDFQKGCYVGQEVTARSKHRASLRKFMHQVQAEEELPSPGTKITVGEREIGEMRSHQDGIGIAILNVEEVRKATQQGIALKAGNVPLKANLPAWCTTNFAELG